jgi:hypothetical protein
MKNLKRFITTSAGLWILFILWALFASNFWLPRNWGFYGSEDWDLTYSTFEAARISIVNYCEWPTYQPFLSFGSNLDANPQAVHASIFFIPILLFGTFYGYKVSILLAILIGLWGMYKLAYSINSDKIIAILIAFIYAGAPYFSRHIFEAGHSNFMFLYVLPFLAFHFRNYIQNYKFKNGMWVLLILAQTIFGGAPFVFIIFSSFLILWAIGFVFIEKQKSIKLIHTFMIILLALLVSSWKVLSVLSLWNDSPRIVHDTSGINLLVWLQSLLDLPTDTATPHKWHEFAIGFPLSILALMLFYIKNIPNYLKWSILLIPILWINLGNMPHKFNPWYFLNQNFPVFDSLRAPSRIGILFLFVFSIASVISFNRILDKRLIYILLIASTLTQTLSYNSISKSMIHTERFEDILNNSSEKLQVVKLSEHNSKNQFLYLRNESLIPNSYEPLHLKRVNDTLSQFIEGAKMVSFSPNKLVLETNASRIKINLRYDKNWTLKGNGKLSNFNGLLSVSDASGTLELEYVNPILKQGILISISALLLSVLIFVLLQRKQSGLYTNPKKTGNFT